MHYRINWDNFREWVFHKYAKSYAPTVYCYAKKYSYMINGNLRDLDTLSPSVRNQVIKCLISLSKYLGAHTQFRQKLRDYGVKLYRSDVFSSFLRMLNGSNSDVLKWYKETNEVLTGNERLLLKFLNFHIYNLIKKLCTRAPGQLKARGSLIINLKVFKLFQSILKWK